MTTCGVLLTVVLVASLTSARPHWHGHDHSESDIFSRHGLELQVPFGGHQMWIYRQTQPRQHPVLYTSTFPHPSPEVKHPHPGYRPREQAKTPWEYHASSINYERRITPDIAPHQWFNRQQEPSVGNPMSSFYHRPEPKIHQISVQNIAQIPSHKSLDDGTSSFDTTGDNNQPLWQKNLSQILKELSEIAVQINHQNLENSRPQSQTYHDYRYKSSDKTILKSVIDSLGLGENINSQERRLVQGPVYSKPNNNENFKNEEALQSALKNLEFAVDLGRKIVDKLLPDDRPSVDYNKPSEVDDKPKAVCSKPTEVYNTPIKHGQVFNRPKEVYDISREYTQVYNTPKEVYNIPREHAQVFNTPKEVYDIPRKYPQIFNTSKEVYNIPKEHAQVFNRSREVFNKPTPVYNLPTEVNKKPMLIATVTTEKNIESQLTDVLCAECVNWNIGRDSTSLKTDIENPTEVEIEDVNEQLEVVDIPKNKEKELNEWINKKEATVVKSVNEPKIKKQAAEDPTDIEVETSKEPEDELESASPVNNPIVEEEAVHTPSKSNIDEIVTETEDLEEDEEIKNYKEFMLNEAKANELKKKLEDSLKQKEAKVDGNNCICTPACVDQDTKDGVGSLDMRFGDDSTHEPRCTKEMDACCKTEIKEKDQVKGEVVDDFAAVEEAKAEDEVTKQDDLEWLAQYDQEADQKVIEPPTEDWICAVLGSCDNQKEKLGVDNIDMRFAVESGDKECPKSGEAGCKSAAADGNRLEVPTEDASEKTGKKAAEQPTQLKVVTEGTNPLKLKEASA